MTTTTTATTISTLIKTARTNAGLSQAEAAKLLGYKSPQNISGWECGTTVPPTSSYKTLCTKLKIDKATFKKLLVKKYEQEITKLLN